MVDKPQIKEYDDPRWADYEIDESCHLCKVEVFDRKEDSLNGMHTTVLGQYVTQDGDMSRNYSARRTSVALHFISETRAAPWDRFVMIIFQHKGGEYVRIMTLQDSRDIHNG